MSKIKGITIWEQYAEFMVLGIACIAFIALTAMQFIGDPHAVEVAGKGKVRPGDVDRILQDEAERINLALASEAPPRVQFSAPGSIYEEFRTQLAASVTPAPRLRLAQYHVPLGIDPSVRDDVTFVEPVVPTPHSVIARQYVDSIEDDVPEQYPDLMQVLGSAPWDLTWVTPAAVFDIGEVLDQFRAGDPQGDPSPIPPSWYGERVPIVNVIVEREELLDGEYTNRIDVAPMPGQFHFRDKLANEIDSAARDNILRALREPGAQLSLVQPPFYPTRNRSWSQPDPFEDQLEGELTQDQRIRLLERRLASMNADREELAQELDRLGGPDAPDRQPPDRAPRPSGGGGGGSGLGGGGGGTLAPPGGERESREQEVRRQRLIQQIERLDRRIAEAMRELQQLRPDVDEGDLADRLEQIRELVVWAHDLDTRPGYTYRYRFAVEVHNPFFARGLHLKPEQEELAKDFTIRTEFSEWSDPVTVEPPLRMFVTRARAADQDREGAIGRVPLGDATIEVYRFYDGRWWNARFSNVEPGQRIGGVREEGRGEAARRIDYGTDWFVLDILPDLDSPGSARDGLAAKVVLQHLENRELMVIRHPMADRNSPELQRLREESAIALRD